MIKIKNIFIIILIIITTLFTTGCNINKEKDIIVTDYYVEDKINNIKVYKDNLYNKHMEVSLYLVGFKELPKNYYNRDEFSKKKYDFTMDNPISCFGGVFRNREKRLPLNDKYYECDVNTTSYQRGSNRLVYNFSYNTVYYTANHYDSFVRIYNDYMYDGVTIYK